VKTGSDEFEQKIAKETKEVCEDLAIECGLPGTGMLERTDVALLLQVEL